MSAGVSVSACVTRAACLGARVAYDAAAGLRDGVMVALINTLDFMKRHAGSMYHWVLHVLGTAGNAGHHFVTMYVKPVSVAALSVLRSLLSSACDHAYGAVCAGFHSCVDISGRIADQACVVGIALMMAVRHVASAAMTCFRSGVLLSEQLWQSFVGILRALWCPLTRTAAIVMSAGVSVSACVTRAACLGARVAYDAAAGLRDGVMVALINTLDFMKRHAGSMYHWVLH